MNVQQLRSEMKIDPEKLSKSLEDFIQKNMRELERSGVILGLSGGIDSALVASLCTRAVGPEKTLALIMPERDSPKQNISDAQDFANQLGIKIKLIDMTPYLTDIGIYKLFPLSNIPGKSFLVKRFHNLYRRIKGRTPFADSLTGFGDREFLGQFKKTTAYYRFKHRLRMALLYLYAEQENRLVVGAANKTEYSIGFYVKHGCDHAVDIMPILNLYKTQVRELANFLNIPKNIIERPPSPDIIPGLTDEKTIGMPYDQLDLILLALEKGLKNQQIAKILEIDQKKASYVRDLTKKSQHMRDTYAP